MSEKITVEGSEFEFSELSSTAQDLVRNVAELDSEMATLWRKHNQLMKARDSFYIELKKEIFNND